MSKAKGKPVEIDPEARYEVKLAKPHLRKGRMMSPMHTHRMTGRMLAEIPADRVASFQIEIET